MQRIEFRELPMFEKLITVKKELMDGKSVEHIASMIDECIYRTSGYMKQKSNKKEIPKYSIRKKRWDKTDIKTEAKRRFEAGIVWE